MNEDQLHAIFVNIHNGKNAYGDFITYFASCYYKADAANRGILYDVEYQIVKKYRLDDEYKKTKGKNDPEI